MSFINDNFMLQTETARKLYHEHAAKMPIIDYHCHLVPQQIAENIQFRDITQLWLVDGHYGDHYKWRAMRANGVSEDYLTGGRPSRNGRRPSRTRCGTRCTTGRTWS